MQNALPEALNGFNYPFLKLPTFYLVKRVLTGTDTAQGTSVRRPDRNTEKTQVLHNQVSCLKPFLLFIIVWGSSHNRAESHTHTVHICACQLPIRNHSVAVLANEEPLWSSWGLNVHSRACHTEEGGVLIFHIPHQIVDTTYIHTLSHTHCPIWGNISENTLFWCWCVWKLPYMPQCHSAFKICQFVPTC